MFKRLKELYRRYMRGARANKFSPPNPKMTFSEMFHLACKVDPEHDSICAQVDCWRHVQRPTQFDLRRSLWSALLNEHFHGNTAEECLIGYQKAYHDFRFKEKSSTNPQEQIVLIDEMS